MSIFTKNAVRHALGTLRDKQSKWKSKHDVSPLGTVDEKCLPDAKRLLRQLRSASPERFHWLRETGLLNAAIGQAIYNGHETYRRFSAFYVSHEHAEEESQRQMLWEVTSLLPFFGTIREVIEIGSLGIDCGQKPVWPDVEHRDLAEYCRQASPERYEIGCREGSLNINVVAICAAARLVRRQMLAAGVDANFVEKYVHTRMHMAVVGARRKPDSLHELIAATGTWYSNEMYYVYVHLFGFETVAQRHFYNLGAGCFHHPLWQNVDLPSDYYAGIPIDIAWNAESCLPIAAPAGKAGAVYTSHTIEHLHDAGAENLFKEAYRLLSPGGFFRITCPDFDRYYAGFEENNLFGFSLPPKAGFDSREQAVSAGFLHEFAQEFSPLYVSHRQDNPSFQKAQAEGVEIPNPLNRQQLESMIAQYGRDEALVQITKSTSPDLHQYIPGDHVNWWPYKRIVEFGHNAGFKRIYRSTYGQSKSTIMQDTAHFDKTVPEISIYVEMIK